MKINASVATLLALVFSAASVAAQLPIPRFAVVGGVSHFDLAETGSTPFGAVRIEIPIATLLAEGSLGAFRPTIAGETRTYVIPEAQLQWQIIPVLVRPYIGAGIGWFRAVSGPTPRSNDVTISGSAGVRIGLPMMGFSLRGEVRTRGIGSGFDLRATEYTVGISR